MANYSNVIRGKQNKAQGDIAERLIMRELDHLGFVMIEKLHNAWFISKIVKRGSKSRLLAWIYPAKISGDYKAVDPQNGKSVLVEVKSTAGRLQHSNIKDHQRQALDDHHAAGAISLLGWYEKETGQIFVMRWPIDGFVRRTSIDIEKAQDHHIGVL